MRCLAISSRVRLETHVSPIRFGCSRFWKRDRMAAASGNAVNTFTRVHFPRLSITFVFSIRPFSLWQKILFASCSIFLLRDKSAPRLARTAVRCGAEIVFKSVNEKKKEKKTCARYGFAVLIVSRTDRILGKYCGGFMRRE